MATSENSGTQRAIKLIAQHWPASLDTVTMFMRDCAETSEVETYTAIAELLLGFGERTAASLVLQMSMRRIAAIQAKIVAQREALG